MLSLLDFSSAIQQAGVGYKDFEIRVLCMPPECQGLENIFGGSEAESTFENAVARI